MFIRSFSESSTLLLLPSLAAQERNVQGSLTLVHISQMLYRLSQFLVARSQDVPLTELKYIALMAQSSALPVAAKLKFCDYNKGFPAIKSLVLGQNSIPALDTKQSQLSKGVFLTADQILGGGTYDEMKANFDKIVNSITANYQCLGFTLCQDLASLLVPPAGVSKEQKERAYGGALAYDTLISTCSSYPNPRSSTVLGSQEQESYFSGVSLTGPVEPPPQMPFIDFTFTSNVWQVRNSLITHFQVLYVALYVSVTSKT